MSDLQFSFPVDRNCYPTTISVWYDVKVDKRLINGKWNVTLHKSLADARGVGVIAFATIPLLLNFKEKKRKR